MLGRMCLWAPLLLGHITDNVSTVAEPKMQCHDNGLPRLTCWVGYVYIHYFGIYELLRNRLAMCELLSYERILDLRYELCETMNSIRFGLLIKLGLTDPKLSIVENKN